MDANMGVKKRQKRTRIGAKRAEKPEALKVKGSAKAKESP
jgi:hypothetical protein